MMTLAHLQSILSYNPDSGIFTWVSGRERGNQLVHCRDGYLVAHPPIGVYAAHRLAFLYMEGRLPQMYVDHIDGNKLNNAWANLRLVTRVENARNTKRNSRNSSGVMGVSWRKDCMTWRAFITLNFKTISLGSFSGFFDAVCARKSAEVRHNFHPNHGAR